MYSRFSAAAFKDCLSDDVTAVTLHHAVTSNLFDSSSNPRDENETAENSHNWSQKIRTLQLPPSVDIVMGDVCGGSSSTSMVRVVDGVRKLRSVLESLTG